MTFGNFYLKDMTADEMSELNDMNGNEISDLTKVSALKGKIVKFGFDG